MIRLAIVCPCYNEEAVIGRSSERLLDLLDRLTAGGKITSDSFVLFVNDGSRDRTWHLIKALHDENPVRFKGIDLAHNAGQLFIALMLTGPAVAAYAPVLAAASVPSGLLTGTALKLSLPLLRRACSFLTGNTPPKK